MDQSDQSSLRILGVGIGTFGVFIGFFILLLILQLGSFLKRPATLYLLSISIYGTFILYLVTSKKRSQEINESETDSMWIIRICFGILLGSSCCVAVGGVTSEILNDEILLKDVNPSQYSNQYHSNNS